MSVNSGEIILGGIEGGATHSELILFDGSMKQLGRSEGPNTNMFQLGIPETAKLLAKMVQDGLSKAGLNANTKLKSLGMSLSGAERPETNQELIEELKKSFPNLCDSYKVVSDTVGPLVTASPNGGIVLIAGTGSNSLLVKPDGSEGRCGGWGHLVGDEGSACWIGLKAVKIYLDHTDAKAPAPHDIGELELAFKDYFGIKDRFDLLDPLYTNWNKAKFAGVTKRLAEGAAKGDKLCMHLFEEAGRELASHLNALAPQVPKDLLATPQGVPVVCIGSVWKSFKFMEPGFTKELKRQSHIKELQLLTLTAPVAIGACYIGADQAGLGVVKDYAKNTQRFHHVKL